MLSSIWRYVGFQILWITKKDTSWPVISFVCRFYIHLIALKHQETYSS